MPLNPGWDDLPNMTPDNTVHAGRRQPGGESRPTDSVRNAVGEAACNDGNLEVAGGADLSDPPKPPGVPPEVPDPNKPPPIEEPPRPIPVPPDDPPPPIVATSRRGSGRSSPWPKTRRPAGRGRRRDQVFSACQEMSNLSLQIVEANRFVNQIARQFTDPLGSGIVAGHQN